MAEKLVQKADSWKVWKVEPMRFADGSDVR